MKRLDAAPQSPPSRWRRFGRTALRGALALVFIGILAGGFVYHSARAQVDRQLFSLGAQMMAYDHADHQDAPRDLVLNGQILRLSSGMTSRPTTDVLDFFEARCDAADGQFALQLERLLRDHPELDSEAPDAPSLREDDGRNGYVACLDLGQGEVDAAELARRIQRFGDTGDVAAIGDARFVFAEQTGEGEASRTHFVAMWTEGEFNVDAMFPEQGDAPGADVDGVSRPPRARRVLSGRERGMPHTITVYQTHETEGDLTRFYRRDLERNGWMVLEPEGPPPTAAPPTLVAERGERMVTLMFQPNAQAGGSTVAIFDTL